MEFSSVVVVLWGVHFVGAVSVVLVVAVVLLAVSVRARVVGEGVSCLGPCSCCGDCRFARLLLEFVVWLLLGADSFVVVAVIVIVLGPRQEIGTKVGVCPLFQSPLSQNPSSNGVKHGQKVGFEGILLPIRVVLHRRVVLE